ncbi:MAG TPA: hypothetical protein VIN58_05695 [Roseateles sp.]
MRLNAVDWREAAASNLNDDLLRTMTLPGARSVEELRGWSASVSQG